jgi:hypothetical protein
MTTHSKNLEKLQEQLAAVRSQLASRAWSGHPARGTEDKSFSKTMIIAIVLFSPGAFLLILALLAIITQDFAVATLFAIPGAIISYVGLRYTRKNVAPKLNQIDKDYNALLQQERALLTQLAALEDNTSPASPELPLPTNRQPSSFAQMMWNRFPMGPSPEKMLRTLPSNAPSWKISFHRSLGWGTVAAILLASGILAIYVSLRMR